MCLCFATASASEEEEDGPGGDRITRLESSHGTDPGAGGFARPFPAIGPRAAVIARCAASDGVGGSIAPLDAASSAAASEGFIARGTPRAARATRGTRRGTG